MKRSLAGMPQRLHVLPDRLISGIAVDFFSAFGTCSEKRAVDPGFSAFMQGNMTAGTAGISIFIKENSLKNAFFFFLLPAGHKAALFCVLALLFLAQPVFAGDVEPVNSPCPVSRAEAPAGKNAADKTNHKTITSFRKGFTQKDKEFIHDFISIFLFMSGMYCGYKVISLYWKFKLETDKWKNAK